MTENSPSPTVPDQAISAGQALQKENGQDASVPADTPAVEPESRTKGILREAIQKVMVEIDNHEKEAQKHLEQARALRKDLRESIAFLKEQGGREASAGISAELRSGASPESRTEGSGESGAAAPKRPAATAKKKRAAGKRKKG